MAAKKHDWVIAAENFKFGTTLKDLTRAEALKAASDMRRSFSLPDRVGIFVERADGTRGRWGAVKC